MIKFFDFQISILSVLKMFEMEMIFLKKYEKIINGNVGSICIFDYGDELNGFQFLRIVVKEELKGD